MSVAIYPGSFDPVTMGHKDIIERAARMFDTLIVAVLINREKMPVFSDRERADMLRKVTRHLDNVKIVYFEGLLALYARENRINTVIKGLRAVSDFDYEFQMALANKKLNPELDTAFLMASEKYMYLSSRIVKDIGAYGGEISEFVPPEILNEVSEKLSSRRE